MRDLLKLASKLKSATLPAWQNAGIPAALAETASSHIVEELLIAVRLARAAGCDTGRVLVTALAREVEELVELSDVAREASEGELAVTELAHELAVVAQAKRYARMGFNVEAVLRDHVARALDVVAKLGERDVAQLVHDFLSA